MPKWQYKRSRTSPGMNDDDTVLSYKTSFWKKSLRNNKTHHMFNCLLKTKRQTKDQKVSHIIIIRLIGTSLSYYIVG